MSAEKPMRRVLSQSEVEGLKERVSMREAEIRGDQPSDPNAYVPKDRMNDPLERASLNRSKETLRRGDPANLDLTAGDKTRMLDRRKFLIDWLKKHMVPKSHIDLKASGDPEFRKSVAAVVRDEMSQQFKQMAVEFKNISRALYPGDPGESNLENIRPATR